MRVDQKTMNWPARISIDTAFDSSGLKSGSICSSR